MTKILLLMTAFLCMLGAAAHAQHFAPAAPATSNPYSGLVDPTAAYPASGPVITEWQPTPAPSGLMYPNTEQLPTSASWIVPADQQPAYVDANVYCEGDPYPQPGMFDRAAQEAWDWQVLPDGLIYRSYWAGVREPRLGVTFIRTNGGQSFWDPTLGGRVGILRYGNDDPIHPQGWQWDFEGAALARLTLDDMRDLESVDFRGGTFVTYGISNWQFKFGYDHLSSHLGDEFIIRTPGSLAERLNYVRDSFVAGASVYPIPEMRLYSEAGYAFNADGGAEPWEFQFGTELAKAGPTGLSGSPFLALNVHLREENSFSGDFTAQTGWMWRGETGQTMRIGFHYLNGKSSQYQNFDKWEEQIGAGVWYDF